jgi:hypothetical protein
MNGYTSQDIAVLISLHSIGVYYGFDLMMVIARYKIPFKPHITVYIRSSSQVTYRIQYNTVVKRS